jgi:hypothetical protein
VEAAGKEDAVRFGLLEVWILVTQPMWAQYPSAQAAPLLATKRSTSIWR